MVNWGLNEVFLPIYILSNLNNIQRVKIREQSSLFLPDIFSQLVALSDGISFFLDISKKQSRKLRKHVVTLVFFREMERERIRDSKFP